MPAAFLLAPALCASDGNPALVNVGGVFNVRLAGTEDPSATRVYIVQLSSPAAVTV